MINYQKESRRIGFKYALVEFYNKNKVLIYIMSALLLIALLTGVFTAVKLLKLDGDLDLKKYSIYALIDGSVYTFKYFMLRLLSVSLMAGLLFVFSLAPWVYAFGFVILIYRGFLITLNCTFVIIKYGFSGMMFPLLVVFLAQIVMVALLAVVFILFLNMLKEKKRCGRFLPDYKHKVFTTFLIILIVALVEMLLLFVFKPTTILII
ncbi:MAG: hypothetical protein IJ318_02315 [Clostridia bacterium]|nr:hypothetical protein [Clostridia bacterium]